MSNNINIPQLCIDVKCIYPVVEHLNTILMVVGKGGWGTAVMNVL